MGLEANLVVGYAGDEAPAALLRRDLRSRDIFGVDLTTITMRSAVSDGPELAAASLTVTLSIS